MPRQLSKKKKKILSILGAKNFVLWMCKILHKTQNVYKDILIMNLKNAS